MEWGFGFRIHDLRFRVSVLGVARILGRVVVGDGNTAKQPAHYSHCFHCQGLVSTFHFLPKKIDFLQAFRCHAYFCNAAVAPAPNP